MVDTSTAMATGSVANDIARPCNAHQGRMMLAQIVAAGVAAVAGSARANEAEIRVGKLESLVCNRKPRTCTLLEAVAMLLADPEELDAIAQVRIARTRRRAAFIFRDGRVEEFCTAKPEGRADRFYVEGILSASLLKLVALAIRSAEDQAGVLEDGISPNDRLMAEGDDE